MQIAIIEDKQEDVEILRTHFARYEKEHNVKFIITTESNPVNFLTSYHCKYDLIIFDIKMPMMNGVEAAQKLRKIDPNVPIVFVTSMNQYAIAGYSVGAVDFLIKPVVYFDFETMLNRVRRIIAASKQENFITVSSAYVIHKVIISHIIYIEVYKHKLTFHTLEGEIESWGNLSDIENQLPSEQFARCNNCFLINLKYVDSIDKELVIIGDVQLPISHLKKKSFTQSLAHYLGQRG